MPPMPDYSKDFDIVHDDERGSCAIRFRCFDTPNAVTAYSGELSWRVLEDALLAARRSCLDFHELWSFSLPESDIARLNQPTSRVRVDTRTARLVQAMKDFNRAEPAFDFTVGPVSFLWKHAERVPGAAELERALSHVGAHKVEVTGDVVVKSDPLAQVDVGGAAKGFVADALALQLREAGISCADIDLGGNLFMLGSHPQGRPWRVAVRVPEGVGARRPVLELSDQSAVTSGSYERFVEIDGKRYQHIVDARTGLPCESDIVSATVVSGSSLEADLLATTACLLGSAGLAGLAARHPACRFVAITASGRVMSFPE